MIENDMPVFIDIGGRKLAMREKGNGFPTVVLEMGLEGAASMYDDIARQIATFTRVIWYDRAGLGQSDPALAPVRTIQDLALDLHALLNQAAIPGPYLLAGHSMGGPLVRFYRDRYPQEVVGIVLIDASHEDQRERFLAALPPEQPGEAGGLARIRNILEVNWKDPGQNEEQIDNLANSELLRTCTTLGDLPLVVISRGRSSYASDFPPAIAEQMEQAWRQMQQELVQLSTNSQHITVARSGHLVNEDEPELIVEVIQQMVMQIREKSKDV